MAIKQDSWHFKFLRAFDSIVDTQYTDDLITAGGTYSCNYCFHVGFKILLSLVGAVAAGLFLFTSGIFLLIVGGLVWEIILWIPTAFMLPIDHVLGNAIPWPSREMAPGLVILSVVVWAIIVTVSVIAACVAHDFYIESLSEEALEKRAKKHRQPKEPGLLYKWYKAKKDKFCPWEPLE